MPYSETLAQRIREALAHRRDVVEKKMFGGIAFMVAGRMACGPQEDRLIVRIGESLARAHIGTPHVKAMDFTGRVMKAFATIEREGLRTTPQLKKWVTMAADFAASDEAPKRAARQSKPAPKPKTDTGKSRPKARKSAKASPKGSSRAQAKRP